MSCKSFYCYIILQLILFSIHVHTENVFVGILSPVICVMDHALTNYFFIMHTLLIYPHRYRIWRGKWKGDYLYKHIFQMLSGFYKKLILGVTGSTGIATVQLLTNSIIPVAPRHFTVMVSIMKSSEIEAI